MSTCSSCGSPIPTGAANCQRCGASISTVSSAPNAKDGGTNSWAAAPEQPELPAWLQTLRAGEQQAASPQQPDFPVDARKTNGPGVQSPFSPADLVDEETLPSWMRSGNLESNNRLSENQPPLRSASVPGPDTDNQNFSDRNMSAGSLIDEQGLPSWMKDQSPGSDGTPSMGRNNIEASSLVQPDALPSWMRSIQPRQPQFPAASASQPLQPYAQPIIPPQGLTGKDLIDEQALPSWMTGMGGVGGVGEMGGPAETRREDAPPLAEQPPTRMSASSLLDENSLPSWMRANGPGGQREQKQETANAFPPAQPVPQEPSQGQLPNMNSNLVAASLIDMDALPNWLRSAGNEPQQAGGAPPSRQQGTGEPGQRSFSVPPRVENVRVPSRPRNEMAPQKGSEAAANAFSSMLGVASSAPYPGQSPQPQQYDRFGRPQEASSQPQSQISMFPGSLPDAQPMGMPPMGNAPMNVPGGTQPGYTLPASPTQGYEQNSNSTTVQGNYASENWQGQPMQQMQQPAGMQMPYGQAMTDQSGPQQKPKKRGIVEALRDFFFRG
ncbi:MAG: hypothetical protein M3Z24_00800 [Chloroflexota bacterium]|nr:hypothetical protein [Chloroflexota bacterium]